jgi:hypothetical protein
LRFRTACETASPRASGARQGYERGLIAGLV